MRQCSASFILHKNARNVFLWSSEVIMMVKLVVIIMMVKLAMEVELLIGGDPNVHM